MDEESHSTSQVSYNSREAAQMNTSVPLHIVNLREVHCVLCRTIHSPGNGANWHDDFSICQDCEVLVLVTYAASRRTFRRGLRRSRNHYGRILGRHQPVLERYEQDLEDLRQALEEISHHVAQARQSFEELQQRHERLLQKLQQRHERLLQKLQQCHERFLQMAEEVMQRALLEEALQHTQPEELADISYSREESALLPATLSFVDSLPCVIITEEHKKKHNELVCTICLDPLSVRSIVNQLPCSHFYHPLCIMPWLKVRRSCPICRYTLSSAFHNGMRQNTNRRMWLREIVHEGSSVHSSSATSNVNEPEVVVRESNNETTDSAVGDREGSIGGWFLFAAAPIVGLVGIALVECFSNLLGDGRGRGSEGHVEFRRQCQQQVRMFSSGSSSSRTPNSRENS